MEYAQKQLGINIMKYSFSEFTQNQRVFFIFLPSNTPQDKNTQIWPNLINSFEQEGREGNKLFDILKIEQHIHFEINLIFKGLNTFIW